MNTILKLKPKQEMELKVKNFIPPFSTEPEIYILEVVPQEDSGMMSPLPMLLREDTPPHICHDLCHHSRARKSNNSLKFHFTFLLHALHESLFLELHIVVAYCFYAFTFQQHINAECSKH